MRIPLGTGARRECLSAPVRRGVVDYLHCWVLGTPRWRRTLAIVWDAALAPINEAQVRARYTKKTFLPSLTLKGIDPELTDGTHGVKWRNRERTRGAERTRTSASR